MKKLFVGLTIVLMAGAVSTVVAGYLMVDTARNPLSKGPAVIVRGRAVAHDTDLGFALYPNNTLHREIPAKGIAYTAYTDDRGARVDKPGDQTPSQVDILAIGGSYTHGSWVENEETFVQLLGAELGLTVANLGVPAYGTTHSVLVLERNLDLKPRYIVYGYIRHHMERNNSPCSLGRTPFCQPQPYVAFDGGLSIHPPHEEYRQSEALERYRKDIKSGRKALWNAKLRLFPGRYYLKSNIEYPDDPASRVAGRDYLIRRMIDDAREIGATFVLVYIPGLRRYDMRPATDLSWLPDDVIYVDVYPAVVEHYEDKNAPLLSFDKDPHPKPIAHALIAKEIAAAIKRSPLAPIF